MNTTAERWILALCACAGALALKGADIYWTGAAENDDSWNTPGNWQGDKVPGNNDRACFNNDYVVQVDDSIQVGSILVSNGKSPVFQGSGSITAVNGSVTGGKGAQYNVPIIFPDGVAATASSQNDYGSTVHFNAGLSGGASVYTGGNQNYGFRATNGVVSVPVVTINCGATLGASFSGESVVLTDTWADGNGNAPNVVFIPSVSFGPQTEVASGIGVPTMTFSNQGHEEPVNFNVPALRIGAASRPTLACDHYDGQNLVTVGSFTREAGGIVRINNNNKSGTFTPGETAGFVVPGMPADAQGLCPAWVYSDIYRVRKQADNALVPLTLNDYTKITGDVSVNDPNGLYRIDYQQHSALSGGTDIDSLILRGNYGSVDDNLMTLDLGDHDLRLRGGNIAMHDYASKIVSASGNGRLVFAADQFVLTTTYNVNRIEVSAPIVWEKPTGSTVEYPDFLMPTYSGAETVFSGEDRVGDWGALFAEGRGNGGSWLIFDGPSDRTFHGAVGGRFWMRKRGSGTLTFAGPNKTRGNDVRVEEGTLVIAHNEAFGIKDCTNGAIVRVARDIAWSNAPVVHKDGILEGFGTVMPTVNHNNLFDGCVLRGGTAKEPGTLTFSSQVTFPTNIVLDAGFSGDVHGQVCGGKLTFRKDLDTTVRVRVSDVDGTANVKPSDVYVVYSWSGSTENYNANRVSLAIENATPKRLDTSAAVASIDTSAKRITVTGIKRKNPGLSIFIR